MSNHRSHAEQISLEDFWRGISEFDLDPSREPSKDIFRTSLEDLNYLAGSTLLLDNIDENFHARHSIVSDKFSWPYFLDLQNRSQTTYNCPPSTGWIYIYSNVAELTLGKNESGMLWWRQVDYECRLKIGKTTKHPIERIRQQARHTANSRALTILGLFATPQPEVAERKIHMAMQEFKVRDISSIEWFDCAPALALEIIRDVLERLREDVPLETSWNDAMTV